MSDAAGYARDAQRHRDAGAWYEALVAQRRAVALLRDGDPAVLACALRHVADIMVEAGRAAEAEAVIAEMLGLYRNLRTASPLDLASAMRSAAVRAEAVGDDETAGAFWQEARTRYLALGLDAAVAEADGRIAALRD